MTTNHVEQLQPGEGCYAFFLNAQGRILGDVNLLCFEDHFLLDTEPETRQKLFEHLDRYIIADDVTIEDRDRIEWQHSPWRGRNRRPTLHGIGVDALPEAPYSTVSWSDARGDQWRVRPSRA